VDALYAKLKERYHFFSAPVVSDEMHIKTVYFRGPESIVVQLTQHLRPTIR
jgi:hypothetical protein